MIRIDAEKPIWCVFTHCDEQPDKPIHIIQTGLTYDQAQAVAMELREEMDKLYSNRFNLNMRIGEVNREIGRGRDKHPEREIRESMLYSEYIIIHKLPRLSFALHEHTNQTCISYGTGRHVLVV